MIAIKLCGKFFTTLIICLSELSLDQASTTAICFDFQLSLHSSIISCRTRLQYCDLTKYLIAIGWLKRSVGAESGGSVHAFELYGNGEWVAPG